MKLPEYRLVLGRFHAKSFAFSNPGPHSVDCPLPAEALELFRAVLARASRLPLIEPTAVTLATVGGDGRVSARVVLLRSWDERGFVFYTNTLSDKGRQLAANPRAALCFHWDALGEQVRIEGPVEFVSGEEADEYWATRPRDSQLGAWASRQSEPLTDRAELEQRLAEFHSTFAHHPVPRPPHWTGYRVLPTRLEFWTTRPARLHERVVYVLENGHWHKRFLYP